jgi:hypothetical protein
LSGPNSPTFTSARAGLLGCGFGSGQHVAALGVSLLNPPPDNGRVE